MEEVVIPEVLKRFSEDLISKQRSYASIKARSLDCELDKDPLDVKSSKFLGKPFIPEGMEYPKDKYGTPLVLIAQINFSELPLLDGYPNEGILQLYFNTKEWWDMTESERVIYITGEDLKKPQSIVVPSISKELYAELPIWKIHKLEYVRV